MIRVININIGSQLILTKSQLSEGMLRLIRQFLTMPNPKFVEAEKHERSTWGIAQFIYAYEEGEDNLYCFRGYVGSLIPFLTQNGYRYKIIDHRKELPEINLDFRGNLRGYQRQAVDNVLKKDFAVLVAPCGSGKTTMALAIVAARRQPTLIVVHTKELLNQWIERIGQYLGIPKAEVGIIGSGKEIIKPITMSMVQTLVKRDLEEIRTHFGQVIVDECHHTPASTFLEVSSKFDSQYMFGLSATPYRRDRLNKLIFLSLGNVAHEVRGCDLQDAGIKIKPEIIVRETDFDFDYQADSDYQPMISALVADVGRNQLIIDDVVQENGGVDNYSLVLSDRKAHLEELESLLENQGINAAILTADVPKKQREQIIRDLDNGSLHIVLATGQLAGEGLDISRLNRLFITTPIKWKGRLLQYVGRGLRAADGKTDARVYDYHDSRVGILDSSYRSRCRVYEGLN